MTANATAFLRSLLMVLIAVVAAACTTTSMTPPARATESLDRAEMMSRLEQSAAAWNRADLKSHLAIYDDSVTVMTKQGPRPTIAAIETAFGATYFVDGKPKQTLRFEQPAIRLLTPDSALMTGRFVLFGGGLAEQSGWFTLVWLRTAAGWRVVHDHTS